MSTTTYITSKKYIDSHSILHYLQSINNDKFDEKLNISVLENDIWIIQFPHDKSTITFNKYSKRKISSTLQSNPWKRYIHAVFENELAFILDGKLSCESFKESWQPIKKKYCNYKDYLKKQTYGVILEIDLRQCPRNMINY